MTARSDRRQRGASTGALLLGATIVSLGALGFWYWSADEGAGGVDPDRVVTVQGRDIINAVNATGAVEPLARVAVMSRASGILMELLADEGDVVGKDQILAELDRELLLRQLEQDEADLSSSRARLAAANARVFQAEVRLSDPELPFARDEYQRLQKLFETGDVTQKERDDAARALEAVQFRVEQVRAELQVLTAQVLEAEAGLAAAQAALDQSQTALSEATIRSPIDGVILTRDLEVGDGVSSLLVAGGNATQIFSMGDLSRMFVEARVDEVDLGRIEVGMPVIITVDAHRGREIEGEVERIAPAGSVDNNGIVTFEVRITVADPEGLLKPDMTADAKLVLERIDGALSLPQRALRRDGPRWVVQKVVGEGESAGTETVEVSLGLSDGLMTQITSGVSEGDRVLLPSGGMGGPPRF